MRWALTSPEKMLDSAVAAVLSRDARQVVALDDLSAPVYVTDSEGVITFYNKACVAFAGHVPIVGKDRWCVTWKLYSDSGQFLPHDKCPMAVAIQTRQLVRNTTAIAERPDGSRIAFKPYPTPILREDGSLLGAVNLLMQTTDNDNVVAFPGGVTPYSEEGLKLMRLFMSIPSKDDRNQVLQMIETYAALLKDIRKT